MEPGRFDAQLSADRGEVGFTGSCTTFNGGGNRCVTDMPTQPFECLPVNHPLAGAKSLRELWLTLLPGAEQPDSAKDLPPSDAPAMVRRVSPWFGIEMPSA